MDFDWKSCRVLRGPFLASFDVGVANDLALKLFRMSHNIESQWPFFTNVFNFNVAAVLGETKDIFIREQC